MGWGTVHLDNILRDNNHNFRDIDVLTLLYLYISTRYALARMAAIRCRVSHCT
jgi:hypothetical protein